MKLFYFLLSLVLFQFVFAQSNGTIDINNLSTYKTTDGSGFLGLTYSQNKCGLNYVQTTQRLGTRFSPAGGITTCGVYCFRLTLYQCGRHYY